MSINEVWSHLVACFLLFIGAAVAGIGFGFVAHLVISFLLIGKDMVAVSDGSIKAAQIFGWSAGGVAVATYTWDVLRKRFTQTGEPKS